MRAYLLKTAMTNNSVQSHLFGRRKRVKNKIRKKGITKEEEEEVVIYHPLVSLSFLLLLSFLFIFTFICICLGRRRRVASRALTSTRNKKYESVIGTIVNYAP